MPCYGPITAYYSKHVNPGTGKRSLVFRVSDSHSGVALTVPCGKCVGCKLERARQWSIRCVHEMKLHHQSAFLTLTYEDRFLPAGGTLVKRHLQLFMKRLRKQRPEGLRFFACGEYGGMTARPHYHVLLLNTCFPDMKMRRVGVEASPTETYASAELSKLWSFGSNVIGQVSFASCFYVAKYCVKTVKSLPDSFYETREREFCVMSRKPGLGFDWYEKYHGEWYDHDSLIVDDREVPLTRYYDSKFAVEDAGRLEDLKRARRRRAMASRSDNTSRRRWTKEQLVSKTLLHFSRSEV